jgi:hypothetical protein
MVGFGFLDNPPSAYSVLYSSFLASNPHHQTVPHHCPTILYVVVPSFFWRIISPSTFFYASVVRPSLHMS